MTLREKFNKLRTAALADVRAVRNRYSVNGGYWESGVSPDGPLLKEDVSVANSLGYETHMRIIDGKLNIVYVKKMTPAPNEVLYA